MFPQSPGSVHNVLFCFSASETNFHNSAKVVIFYQKQSNLFTIYHITELPIFGHFFCKILTKVRLLFHSHLFLGNHGFEKKEKREK
jgi:hypothetical protein